MQGTYLSTSLSVGRFEHFVTSGDPNVGMHVADMRILPNAEKKSMQGTYLSTNVCAQITYRRYYL